MHSTRGANDTLPLKGRAGIPLHRCCMLFNTFMRDLVLADSQWPNQESDILFPSPSLLPSALAWAADAARGAAFGDAPQMSIEDRAKKRGSAKPSGLGDFRRRKHHTRVG